MVKTSILFEVDEYVNDMVVKPHKRAKTFSKLIATLLQGYISDDYIRAYAEGTLDDMRKASVDALEETLNSMDESLFALGVYAGEIKNANKQGVSDFKKKEEEIRDSMQEVEDLKCSVNDLKNQNERILLLLEKALSNGDLRTNTINETTIRKEEFVEEVVEEPLYRVKEEYANTFSNDSYVEDFSKSEIETRELENENVENVTKEITDLGISVNDLVAGLVAGNKYSF